MSDDMRRMHLDMQEMRIKTFIRAKLHLPETDIQFYEWLKDFEDFSAIEVVNRESQRFFQC